MERNVETTVTFLIDNKVMVKFVSKGKETVLVGEREAVTAALKKAWTNIAFSLMLFD